MTKVNIDNFEFIIKDNSRVVGLITENTDEVNIILSPNCSMYPKGVKQ